MTELRDLFWLAFADDGLVCLVAAAFASLLVGRRLGSGPVAALAFLACWIYPVATLARAYGRGVAVEIAKEAILSLPADAVWLGLRFGGMYVVVALLWRARLALHGRRPVQTIAQRTA